MKKNTACNPKTVPADPKHTASPPLSVAEYAKHRGVTRQAVELAIRKKRIAAKKIAGHWRIDPVVADPEWEANTHPAQAAKQDVPALPTYAESKAARAIYEARLAQLEYEQRAGELISARKVAEDWALVATKIRAAVTGLPSRVVNRLPGDQRRELYRLLTEEVRLLLNRLRDDLKGAMSDDKLDAA
jgi:hypothetical protein